MLSEVQDKEKDNPAISDLLFYSFRLAWQEPESPSIRYIHEHYCSSISVGTLSDLEHYNASYYSQWFRKKMGATPQAYVQILRLNEAKRLLRETDFSVLDVAHQVGYEHQASLTRLFRRFEAMTPSEYRWKSRRHDFS
jgi:AraC-like DNA-binding protein